MKKAFFWLVLYSLASGYAVSPALAKGKARVRELAISVAEESVGVSFFVENCFSPKIEKTIQNGVPATITFFVRLYRSRSLWKDKRLASLKFTHRIHYDNLKKVYQVFPQATSPPVLFKQFSEARERCARVEGVKVVPKRPLRERVTYYISVKAEIKPEGLPFRLDDLLFFVSSGKRKTDWIVQKFKIGFFVLPAKGRKADEGDSLQETREQEREPKEKE